MKRSFPFITLAALILNLPPQARSSGTNDAFYTIGIYAVNSTNDFRMVKDGGFNVITGPAERGFLDAAQECGLKVLATPGGTQAGSGFDAPAVRQSVQTFDSHPALWAWYLSDEPDLNLVPPEAILSAQQTVKGARAEKPTALVIYQGYSALDYANLADITMVDRYPIPWLPLANFGQHVAMVRLALGKDKPLVAVIQAFDWTADKQALPGQKNLRPPTCQEMRCMTYDALARGATGLFYFAFDAGWKMREHPDTWSGLTNIIGEVRERLPLFAGKAIWWPRDHAFTDPDKQYNAALESSISSRLLRVGEGSARVPAGDYVVAVNNTENPNGYSFALPAGAASPVPVLGEGRSLEPTRRRLQDNFGPYAVHIYGPL